MDTNVLSETSPETPEATRAHFVHWLRANSDRLHISTMTVAELINGIARLRRMGAKRRAIALETWMHDAMLGYADRILALDIAAARATGALIDAASAKGRPTGFADLAIAGVAMANGLTVLTRNLRHFAPLGVPACDPYEALPP